MHIEKNQSESEKKTPVQKPTKHQQRLIDEYNNRLSSLIEDFALEMTGDESQEDADLLANFDKKWRIIAQAVNASNKPIRLHLDAFTNRVSEYLANIKSESKVLTPETETTDQPQ